MKYLQGKTKFVKKKLSGGGGGLKGKKKAFFILFENLCPGNCAPPSPPNSSNITLKHAYHLEEKDFQKREFFFFPQLHVKDGDDSTWF